MTLALVVASAVLLILGFVQDALGFIYLSMLCAGVAALALIVFARLTRRRAALVTGSQVAARLGTSTPATAGTPAFETRPVERTWARLDPQPQPEPEAEPEQEEVASGVVSTAEFQAIPVGAPELEEEPEIDEEPGAESWADWGEEVVFPIEGYDDLRVAEIVPLLGRLDPDELQEVRDREVSGKARATILDRIDDRLGVTPARRAAPATTTEPVDAPDAAAERTATPEPTAAAEPAVPAAVGLGETLEQEAIPPSVGEPEPEVAKKAPAKKAPAKKAPAAKRTPAKKVVEPAKKAPAVKAPAARAATAKKASKAVSSEEPAKVTKAPGTATSATKKAGPSAKAAPARATDPAGTPPKKAQPARKAAKKTD